MGHQFYFNSLPFECNETTNYLGLGFPGNVYWKADRQLQRFCPLIPEIEYMEPQNETIQRMVYSDSDETWILACHQLILFILVAGRAVMPNSKAWLHAPLTATDIIYQTGSRSHDKGWWSGPFPKRDSQGWENAADCWLYWKCRWYYWVCKWNCWRSTRRFMQ